MSLQAVRNRYVDNAVSTVSPARLVTMLYDALVADLVKAEDALKRVDVQVAHDRLVHAQEIILELQAGLDVTKWDGGPALLSLYHYLYARLVDANVRKDAAVVRSVHATVEPLRQAWHVAAGSAA